MPRILVRRACGVDLEIDLGNKAGTDLLRYKKLRDGLLHSSLSEEQARVTKKELKEAEQAIRGYFEQLSRSGLKLFGLYAAVLDNDSIEKGFLSLRKGREGSAC